MRKTIPPERFYHQWIIKIPFVYSAVLHAAAKVNQKAAAMGLQVGYGIAGRKMSQRKIDRARRRAELKTPPIVSSRPREIRYGFLLGVTISILIILAVLAVVQ